MADREKGIYEEKTGTERTQQKAGPEKIGKLENELRELETVQRNIYNQYRVEVSRVLNEKQRERYNNFFDTENRKMIHPSHQRRYD